MELNPAILVPQVNIHQVQVHHPAQIVQKEAIVPEALILHPVKQVHTIPIQERNNNLIVHPVLMAMHVLEEMT